MDVTTPPLERPFADGRLAIRVSSEAWAFSFVDFAQALVDEYRGEIVQKLGRLGTDEVYWDIWIEGHILTLHSQHYLGVFLCSTDDPSEEYLRRLVPFVETYWNSRQKAGFAYWMKSAWRRVRTTMAAVRG